MQVRFTCDGSAKNITHECKPLPFNTNDKEKPYRCGFWSKRTADSNAKRIL
jgi:hypothetical protein